MIRSRISASSGVLSPLRWLHGAHAATVFNQMFLPPRERGCTWSIVVAEPDSTRTGARHG